MPLSFYPAYFGSWTKRLKSWTWKQLALHNKPIIIYNANGFWTPLLKLIDHMIETGFAPKNIYLIFKTVIIWTAFRRAFAPSAMLIPRRELREGKFIRTDRHGFPSNILKKFFFLEKR
jgi:hypothetical protein